MGRILLVLAVFGFTFTIDADAKPLYLCDDGKTVLLTDRAELGCPVYTPKGELITVPDGATWADVKWAVATKQADRLPARRSADRTQDVCREWIDLNLRTNGGYQVDVEDAQRWVTLSRIVIDTNICEGYLGSEVFPRF